MNVYADCRTVENGWIQHWGIADPIRGMWYPLGNKELWSNTKEYPQYCTRESFVKNRAFYGGPKLEDTMLVMAEPPIFLFEIYDYEGLEGNNETPAETNTRLLRQSML